MIDKQSLLKDIGDFHTNCRRDYGKIEESTNKKILIGYLNKLFVLNLKKDIIGGKYDVKTIKTIKFKMTKKLINQLMDEWIKIDRSSAEMRIVEDKL